LKNRSLESGNIPKPSLDHSHRTTREGRAKSGPVPLTLSLRQDIDHTPIAECAVDPLAGFIPTRAKGS
jgi:hypothetical protein